MKIAIASGKGGTGKTMIATNLAWYLAQQGEAVVYADVDVEEPNGHIFLKPTFDQCHQVNVLVPKVKQDLCQHCGQCTEFCQYNAIAEMPNEVLIYPELCHSCGGCWKLCPVGAIATRQHLMGEVFIGSAGKVACVKGQLKVGQARAVPVIEAVKKVLKEEPAWVIYDAPPGTSCPVVASVRDVDKVVLVTEPTPFGLHDLRLAVAMVRVLGVPFAVVVNRADIGDQEVYQFCQEQNIPILAEIPHDEHLAQAYSRGELVVERSERYQTLFAGLWRAIVGGGPE